VLGFPVTGDQQQPVWTVETSIRFDAGPGSVKANLQIPARMIRGVMLADQQRRVDPTPWLEVHDGDRWRYFNPSTGAEGLPNRYLVWWRGNQPLVRIEGGSNVEVNIAVQKNFLDSMSIAEQRARVEGSLLVDFSLFGLPIQTQAVYSVLLMIPIGALIKVVMRNVIGIDAFGTFMPVLIALAFRETQLLWGVRLFTLLVALGLSIRFLPDPTFRSPTARVCPTVSIALTKFLIQQPTLFREQWSAGSNFRRSSKGRCRWMRKAEQEAEA